MDTVKFGIIGCGLMGREFASAAARWKHLPDMDVRPEIVSICDVNMNAQMKSWYTELLPSVKQAVTDYKELLANKEVQAVYCAVPHNLHEEFYTAVINAGKHLMGEKPFGVDKKANDSITAAIKNHPECVVRCSSEFPFAPAMQRLCSMIEQDKFGTILEVDAGFVHSSDLDTSKPINWKRIAKFNGEYGVMGDLGMHPCHVPFKAGWKPKNVRAILSKVVPKRPDGKGGMADCDTWDNATLFCETPDPKTGMCFPMTIKTQRIAPGEKNTWYITILGMKASVRFNTKNINHIEIMEYVPGGDQAWQHIDMGHETAFKSVTGGIFEFGFSDAILQMWAAFLYEIKHGRPEKHFTGCVTPEEAALSHRLFTAALESQKTGKTVTV
ncbi:MAG: Gfo/Idh/MocA family oxidoreductase [Spirochaetales bacterium]|nr:MAG: Gfo/Idh/MocA family oxidoreductase [Spirochaetales bacterium]